MNHEQPARRHLQSIVTNRTQDDSTQDDRNQDDGTRDDRARTDEKRGDRDSLICRRAGWGFPANAGFMPLGRGPRP